MVEKNKDDAVKASVGDITGWRHSDGSVIADISARVLAYRPYHPFDEPDIGIHPFRVEVRGRDQGW